MNVFTYGSLMYQPVWSRVVAGSYPSRPGILRGHHRRRLLDQVYPGVVPAGRDEVVSGVCYLDVSVTDLDRLDHFEGEDYLRTIVPVELVGGGVVEAGVYLYRHPERLSAELWDPERFEREHLGYFLATYYRERMPEPEG